MTRFQLLQLIISLIGVLVIPFVIAALRQFAATRTRSLDALSVKIDQSQVAAVTAASKVEEVGRVQAHDIRIRLERIENGLIERIRSLETKLDAHIQWHLVRTPPTMPPESERS